MEELKACWYILLYGMGFAYVYHYHEAWWPYRYLIGYIILAWIFQRHVWPHRQAIWQAYRAWAWWVQVPIGIVFVAVTWMFWQLTVATVVFFYLVLFT